jgi:hypothetical protein
MVIAADRCEWGAQVDRLQEREVRFAISAQHEQITLERAQENTIGVSVDYLT